MTLTTNTHGGRRPGAGGRPGNINALKRGKRSPRYAQAVLMVNALSVLWSHELRLPGEPRARRRRRRQLLEAANWFMTRNPQYAEYTEELISGYLGKPGLVPDQDLILEWLDQPRRNPVWLRPLVIVFDICEHNEDIGEKVSRHLIDWVLAGLRVDEAEIPLPNDQTIKPSSSRVR